MGPISYNYHLLLYIDITETKMKQYGKTTVSDYPKNALNHLHFFTNKNKVVR